MSKPSLVKQISADPNAALPTWLNQEELQQLLQQNGNITSIRTQVEQFSQSSLHVQVTVNDQLVNYLVKSEQLGGAVVSKIPRAYSHQMELHMYNVVLPELVQLFKHVGKDVAFSPLNHKLKATKPSCLYLDYPQAKNYRRANQAKGLNQNAMKSILIKLAEYHAGTARYLQTNPEEIRKMQELSMPKLDKERVEHKIWLRRKFSESLRFNDLQHYEDKVKSYLKYLLSCQNTQSDPKRSFCVISVGACWPSNVLGHFDAFGNLKDTLFVDFGGALTTCASYDLFQLLLTAPAEKTEQFDAYLRYYQDELVANLRLLGFRGKLPTLTDLQLELLSFSHWGFEVAVEILPLVLADFDSPVDEDPFKTALYSLELQKILPWLENRAYLEESNE